MPGNLLPILMYHHIAEPPRAVKVRGLYVTPKQFEWQIQCLKEAGFEFTNFRKLTNQNGEQFSTSSSKRQIILTFDDGYLDNYENAFPILRHYGITAVIYPVVGAIGKKKVIWKENDEQYPVDLMTKNAIQEMHQAGVEFGSHLYDHMHLEQQTQASIQNQLCRSKEILENILGEDVLSVAYPFGSYSSTVLQATAEAGYQYGLTTVSGINTAQQPHLELKRTAIKGNRLHHRWTFMKQLQHELLA
ncbi:MAG: polysaccharide deacetylase family protein [SAR324 cluster bacterium]|nr:polysaccharide deacetylase family protein [SAR324 cluster bacterium]